MLHRFSQAIQLLRAFGISWVLFRVRYALRTRLGLLQLRSPQKTWQQIPADFGTSPYFGEIHGVSSGESRWCAQCCDHEIPRTPECGNVAKNTPTTPFDCTEAQEILDGKFRLFSWKTVTVGRFPDWHASPLDPSCRAPAQSHWSKLGDFSFGDIKNIWELNRWAWAFPLARAYRATKREEFAERFWELAENWFAENPPNSGVNWKCGQETSFRLFASLFARCALQNAAATTPERVTAWRRFVWASGKRIAANFDYALSQSNNHGISECVGLLVAGSLVGGNAGKKWFARGKRALKAQLAALVYPDGGFSQHSAVYHRVLIHDLLWAETAIRNSHSETPDWLKTATNRAGAFLAAITDTKTGTAHLYGANDGANILPSFTPDEFANFRSTTNPWAGAAKRYFPDAGVFVVQRHEVSVLMRCVTRFRHRATRDMLHLPALYRGTPVLLNPGTFSYNPKPDSQFAEGFSSAFNHNTATCENADQMQKLGRFLYLPWSTGKVLYKHDSADFTAENHAYRKRFSATHTRNFDSPRITENNTTFDVTDTFESPVPRRWCLHWLLANGQGTLTPATFDADNASWHGAFSLEIPATSSAAAIRLRVEWEAELTPPADATEFTAVRASPDGTRGWYSPHYQEALPAWSLAINLPATTRARIHTRFTFLP